MRKTKFLALALAVAVMMMGAGYAYWTETLTIKSTVDTGNLEVQFQSPDEASENEYMYNSSCDLVTGKPQQLMIQLVDAYPGAEVPIKFSLKNTGTLAAYVNGFEVTDMSGKRTVKDQILCTEIQVEGKSKQVFAEGTTLSAALADLKIDLDSEKQEAKQDPDTVDAQDKEVKMTIQINPAANDTNFAQDSQSTNQTARYGFVITADVRQFNDNEVKED